MLTHLASFEARLDINPSNTAQIASKRSPRSPMGAWHQFWHRQRPDRVPGTNFSGGWHQFFGCLVPVLPLVSLQLGAWHQIGHQIGCRGFASP